MGAQNAKLETESAVDTMDFVNKIVNGGGGGLRKEAPLPSQPMNKNLGERLDTAFDFNFPQIPAYEGI